MDAVRTEVYGWQGVELRNAWVTLRAVPDIGGRVVGYRLGPYECLWLNKRYLGKLFTPEEHLGDGSMDAWINYGGDKTWPAPQGWDNDDQWHGPPDPVLDGGRYTLDLLEADEMSATVRMTSPADPQTGMQITRQATLHHGGSRVTLALTFTNTSDRPRRWSIWDVFQHRAEKILPDGTLTHQDACAVTTPLNPASRHPKGYQVMFADPANPQWQVEDGLFVARYLYRVGKVGLDSLGGWIAFSDAAQGYAFAAQFTPQPGAEYPDNGSTVECWTVGLGEVPGLKLNYAGSSIYLMETEVLSPLFDFAPGQSHTFTIAWGVCRCPSKVVGAAAAGVAARKLSAAHDGDHVHLQGVFGVFDAGQAVLQLLDSQGRVIRQRALGEVDPLTVLTVDVLLPLTGAAAARLVVVATADGQERLLDETAI